MNKGQERIQRAFAQVLGNPSSLPTEAHEIVYEAMLKDSQRPAKRINVTSESRGQICPHETLAQAAVRDYIINILNLAAYKPTEEKITKIKT